MVLPMWDGMTLIPGRDCGDCTVCCTWPTIDKSEIQKKSGTTCKHCTSGGCAIYETRFPVCRGFYCAWRSVPIFDEAWRPDKSGVMPYIETEGIGPDFAFDTGIGLMLVGDADAIVRQDWFQDFVVTGVMNSIPLFLSLPGPVGHQAATASLNTQQMLDAIRRKKVGQALAEALALLRGWDFVPAVITHTGNDVSR